MDWPFLVVKLCSCWQQLPTEAGAAWRFFFLWNHVVYVCLFHELVVLCFYHVCKRIGSNFMHLSFFSSSLAGMIAAYDKHINVQRTVWLSWKKTCVHHHAPLDGFCSLWPHTSVDMGIWLSKLGIKKRSRNGWFNPVCGSCASGKARVRTFQASWNGAEGHSGQCEAWGRPKVDMPATCRWI